MLEIYTENPSVMNYHFEKGTNERYALDLLNEHIVGGLLLAGGVGSLTGSIYSLGNPKFDASPECLIPLGLAFILGGVSVIENSKNIQKPDT
jgi:ABC-type glucose/galactose transport system permease subunit